MLFRNPVFPHNFPDPFVLKHRGVYWAYSTGFQKDGNVFGVLSSKDLVTWKEHASAMRPLKGDATCYWAPEVTAEDDGSFLMYYSVGNEERMTIRAARASQPQGPFEDCGVALTTESFAIDAHVFIDEDGSRYLFYATDFLDYQNIGTGTVRDRMLDPLRLEGKPVPVVRAKYDWQVYDPKRVTKGNVKWHTVEGPCVLKRKGLYYMMFSGGNWQNITYGVSYATSQDLNNASEEWKQDADGEKVVPILRTIPGSVVGPGHNSVVRGPDNRQLYCVYHEWVKDERVMAIDPLEFIGEKLLVLGPSNSDQETPILPRKAGITSSSDRVSFIRPERASYLLELWIRLKGDCTMTIGSLSKTFSATSDDYGPILLRIEMYGNACKWRLGNGAAKSETVRETADEIKLEASTFLAIEEAEITYGLEEEFEDSNMTDLQSKGWIMEKLSSWTMSGRSLDSTSPSEVRHSLEGLQNFEIVCNLRMNEGVVENYASVVLRGPNDQVEVGLSKTDSGLSLFYSKKGVTTRYDTIATPLSPDYHQLRIRLVNSQLSLFSLHRMELGKIEFSPEGIALLTGGPASFEYLRITEIASK